MPPLHPKLKLALHLLFRTMNTLRSAPVLYCSFFLLMSVLPISGCTPEADPVVRIFCDAENVVETPKGIKFSTGNHLFDHAQNRSEEEAYSGSASVLLFADRAYGMTHQLNDLREGERLVIRARRKANAGSGTLVAAAKPIHLSYYASSEAVPGEMNQGWDLLELRLDVPYGVDTMLFYVYNSSPDSVYFDDLEILRMPASSNRMVDGIDQLKLEIDTVDLNTMAEMRADALLCGVITDDHKEEFDCSLKSDDEEYPVEIRFKGDWTDHLKTSKWSYRVKIADGRALNGKRTFSIQHPNTRNYLEEWFLHQLFMHEGVLTTAYDFVNVSINGINKGVYAREEHFEKQLLESQFRREGVILKLDESLFWKIQTNSDKLNWGGYSIPDIEAATILPFKTKKTLRSEVLTKQFETGRNLLSKLKNFDQNISSYLDVDQFARYYAVQLLAYTGHGSRWHNQRWYANPVTVKLEPIAYDCVTVQVDPDTTGSVFDFLKESSPSRDQYCTYLLYNNPQFCQLLRSHLDRMTEPEYLDSFLKKVDPELGKNLTVLQSEFPRYSFDAERYRKFAELVRSDLSDLDDWIAKNSLVTLVEHVNSTESPVFLSESMAPEVFLVPGAKNPTYTVRNYAPRAVNAIGFVESGTAEQTLFKQPVRIPEYGSESIATVKTTAKAKRLLFKFEGSDSTLVIAPHKWTIPKPVSPKDELAKFPMDHPSVASFTETEIQLKAGVHSYESLFVFPEGVALEIPAGTTIKFEKGGGMLIQGAVKLKGTEAEPITITGQSKDNQGFTVLQANTDSKVEHVVFENLNTLRKKGWTLTGAVNFYEANVSVDHCQFNANNCEDALNIIRSEFNVSNCSFRNVFGDAFDSDFCRGVLTKTTFNDIANDGIDFSGSLVDVSDCEFNGIGDKAVSGGEQSTLTVTGMTVNKAEIGIASKDLSLVEVSNSALKDCNFGYVAYTKKPEYGGADLKIENVSISDLNTEFDIERKSTLTLNGKVIEGKGESKIEKY